MKPVEPKARHDLWAVVEPTGNMWTPGAFVKDERNLAEVVGGRSWKQLYKAGWRVVRVEIKPMKGSK